MHGREKKKNKKIYVGARRQPGNTRYDDDYRFQMTKRYLYLFLLLFLLLLPSASSRRLLNAIRSVSLGRS